MENRINYLLLFIIVIVGVAVGNVVSNWIISKYSEKDTVVQVRTDETKSSHDLSSQAKKPEKREQIDNNKKTELRETIKLSPENSEKSDDTKPTINSEELIEQRKLDENGIRLAKQCSEWTVVHKDMQTKTSEHGMNKYCDQYYDYISFGTLPKAN